LEGRLNSAAWKNLKIFDSMINDALFFGEAGLKKEDSQHHFLIISYQRRGWKENCKRKKLERTN